MKKINFIFLSMLVVTVINCTGQKESTTTPEARTGDLICVTLGSVLTPAANSEPGNPAYSSGCCDGLKPMTEAKDCINGAAPGKAVCGLCGDTVCDPNLENNCNCPTDCK